MEQQKFKLAAAKTGGEERPELARRWVRQWALLLLDQLKSRPNYCESDDLVCLCVVQISLSTSVTLIFHCQFPRHGQVDSGRKIEPSLPTRILYGAKRRKPILRVAKQRP